MAHDWMSRLSSRYDDKNLNESSRRVAGNIPLRSIGAAEQQRMLDGSIVYHVTDADSEAHTRIHKETSAFLAISDSDSRDFNSL